MTRNTATRWQFSLRALLLAVPAVAVLVVAWRLLGNDVFLWVAFVFVSAAPAVMLKAPAKRAYLLAYFAVYGPFLVMATYAFFFVACSHCKETTWAVLPYGPGVVPVEVALRTLDLPRLGDPLGSGMTLLVSAIMVTGLTWLVRTRGHWLQALSVTGVLALCTFGAMVVLALIRA